MERILCAAVYLNDRVVRPHEPALTGIVIPGYRHAHCIELAGLIYPDWRVTQGCQGFLTSEGRFVDRTEAADIAKAAGQVPKDFTSCHLFSEDLY